MESKSFRPVVLALGIAVLTLLAADPALATDKPLIVRATAANLMPDLAYSGLTGDGDPFDVRSDADTGWALGIEFLATPRLGIAFQYSSADPKVTLNLDASPQYPELISRTSLGVTSSIASLNLHLTPNRAIDVYLSPVVAYLSFDDLTFVLEAEGQTDSEHFSVKSDLTWGIGIGMDIPIGKSGWLATASVNYLDSRLEVEQVDEPGAETLGFDPLIVSAGIGYRF